MAEYSNLPCLPEVAPTLPWSRCTDDNPLFFSLQYDTDAGNAWIPVGTDTLTTSYPLDVSMLPDGSEILLRVAASDGINTTYDQADSLITVGSKPPVANISSPEGDLFLLPSSFLWFQGSAYDLEDGILAESALTWMSSIEGELDTGRQILETLSLGQHIITLVATDSDGYKSSDSVSVFVGYRSFIPSVQR